MRLRGALREIWEVSRVHLKRTVMIPISSIREIWRGRARGRMVEVAEDLWTSWCASLRSPPRMQLGGKLSQRPRRTSQVERERVERLTWLAISKKIPKAFSRSSQMCDSLRETYCQVTIELVRPPRDSSSLLIDSLPVLVWAPLSINQTGTCWEMVIQ